jgi:non-ribosomal peptide synthetase component F
LAIAALCVVQVPTGDPGEICFGGGGHGFMARGYWKLDEMTAEKFVLTKKFGRLYRTGDVGRWEAGQLLVAGRLDRQVT